MPDPDLNLLLHGASAALPEQIRLRAGPLTLVLEAGDLRYISLGRREVVRRIYGAVRDRDWRTVRGQLSDVVVSSEHDRFHASYRSEHRDGAIDFVWRAAIEGRPDGTIAFAFSGEARSTFESNRIGLCVLHPMRECAGRPARARLTTGTELDVQFPELVAVEQPIHGFSDLAGLTYDAGGGARIELAFEGDTFETEDQRNWIDASFKTYSTPLSLPRPVVVSEGTRIEQRVTLRLHAPGRIDLSASAPGVRDAGAADPVEAHEGKMPGIGIGLGALDAAATPPTLDLLKNLHPAHVRVDLPLVIDGWQDRLDRALDVQRILGCGLELALQVAPGSGADLDALASLLPPRVPVARILVFAADRPTTSAEALALVRARLIAPRPDLRAVGVGSRADLYELHLYPPPDADLICWPMNPHAHASDVTSLAETPPAAGEQVRSVRRRHPAAFTAITPVTLEPRTRTSAASSREPHPLHASLFGAAWTLAIAAHLAEAGAGSATFFEHVQELGSADHNIYPLFHVLSDLCDCADGRVIPQGSAGGSLADDEDEGDSTGGTASLLVRRDSGSVLLLANLSPHPRTVRIPQAFAPASVRVLDTATAQRAAADRQGFRRHARAAGGATSIELAAFATARLEGEVTEPR